MADAPEPDADSPEPAPDRVAVPVLRPAKPRILQDGRDLFWSIAPIVLACVVLAGVLGMCSFAPNGPTVGAPPNYDAHAALQADARELGFPIREPGLPDGWHAQSGNRDAIDAGRTDAPGQAARAVVSVVGYLSPGGKYMSVRQSNADEEKLVARVNSSLVPHGADNVDHVRWVVYRGGEGTEQVWVTRLETPAPGTTVAITGAGSTNDYLTVARAIQSAQPLPAR